jgi:RHS repeat-associated protein
MGGSLANTGLPTAVSSATYDAANELTAWAGSTISYDANGNMTNDGTNTYTWNARNQLASMNSGANSFVYDGYGRRMTKTISSAATSFLYDGVNPVQELLGTTPTANLLTGGLDEYFTRTDTGGTANFLTDALGSTLALTNGSGTVQTQYSFDPFGGTASSGSSTTNSFAYTGREDDGTSLYFLRARYYNPTLGRFISEDPLGLGAGLNMYSYADNSPLFWVDPLGLDVVIRIYQGQGPNVFGHAGIGVNTNLLSSYARNGTYGFYPKWEDPTLLVESAAGEVQPDALNRPGECFVIHTTPGQDAAIESYIESRRRNPGNWYLYGRNCANFVEDALRAGGLYAPDTIRPKKLGDDLRRYYKVEPCPPNNRP